AGAAVGAPAPGRDGARGCEPRAPGRGRGGGSGATRGRGRLMAGGGAGGDPRNARAGGATGAAEAPWRGRRLHLVGVGGAGLSAYARAAHALGAEVTGSDASDTVYARALAQDGVLEPSIGHSADHVPAGDDVELIYS